jgi:serine/threonine protein kinase
MFDPKRRPPPRDEEASGTGPKGSRVPLNDEATEVLSPEEMRSSRPLELSPGDALGDYVLEKIIGDGGGGIVFSARHRITNRAVAIKVLRPEMAMLSKMVTRFVREAEAVNRIRHPNIVGLLDFGEISPGRPYCVMELLEGMDLGKYLRASGRFSPHKCLALFEPILSAVSAAHKAGLIHRDIKASNVFIAQNNGQRVVKLLDFGIAKDVNSEPGKEGLTEPGTRLGTAHNMPPEQIRC